MEVLRDNEQVGELISCLHKFSPDKFAMLLVQRYTLLLAIDCFYYFLSKD